MPASAYGARAASLLRPDSLVTTKARDDKTPTRCVRIGAESCASNLLSFGSVYVDLYTLRNRGRNRLGTGQNCREVIAQSVTKRAVVQSGHTEHDVNGLAQLRGQVLKIELAASDVLPMKRGRLSSHRRVYLRSGKLAKVGRFASVLVTIGTANGDVILNLPELSLLEPSSPRPS